MSRLSTFARYNWENGWDGAGPCSGGSSKARTTVDSPAKGVCPRGSIFRGLRAATVHRDGDGAILGIEVHPMDGFSSSSGHVQE